MVAGGAVIISTVMELLSDLGERSSTLERFHSFVTAQVCAHLENSLECLVCYLTHLIVCTAQKLVSSSD